MCVYRDRQSHPDIRSFKQIQMTVNALPQFHIATQHTSKFLPRYCRAADVAKSYFSMGWRNSGMWCNPTWRVGQTGYRIIPSFLCKVTAASSFLCHLLSSTHSHKTPLPGHLSNCPKFRICSWCCIGWAWVAHSEYSRHGYYECNKDNWLTHCANWRPTEVLSVSSASLCECLSISSILTVNLWVCS